MKVVNLPTPTKKGSMSWTAKPKSAKKGDDSSKTCSDIIPYKGSLPPIGNIVLESFPPPSARTHSSRRSTTSRPKPPTPKPSVDAPPLAGPMVARERHLHQPHLPLPKGEFVISKLCSFFTLVIFGLSCS